jgi:hypothetical protein
MGLRIYVMVAGAALGFGLSTGCLSGDSRSGGGGVDAGPGGGNGSHDGAVGQGPDAAIGEVTCLFPEGADTSGTHSLEDPLGEATVEVHEPDACHRSYTLATTQVLRDHLPENPRTVAERPGWPTARTGNDLVDALYALTLEEVRELSVDAIRDWGFNYGDAVSCGQGGCFETGRKWNYVWTRDTAYAVDLGLANLNLTRARNSLEFKLSERRGGGDLQIVQDTGTGGSYPVSSDRVSWAVGAWELHNQLDGEARREFRAHALEAIANTLEHDREVVYDSRDGLYFGEQSFLDWREQSYAEWTAQNTVHIGMSKALNTNLVHLRAMEVASAFADLEGDAAAASRYAGWADELRQAIRDELWLEDEGMFSTFKTTVLDPAPTRRFDLLGSSFAVMFGVADADQAASILANYPHYGPGAPVHWPQQQLTPIYHNRGEWPFVTAYWLRAAKVADNDTVASKMVRALVRGTALNLSNMELLDAAYGSPEQDDGDYSGPVNNSQRQLWSVAAYVSMIHHTIFGLEATPAGLEIRPYLTRDLRNDLFAGTDELILNDYPFRGKRVSVVLHVPPAGGTGGAYGLGEVRIDGVAHTGVITPADLAGHSRVDVWLTDAGDRVPAAIETRDNDAWRQIFQPRTPRITGLAAEGSALRLTLSTNGEDAATVTYAVYRDGERIADGLEGTSASYTDQSADPQAARSPCYAVETCFIESGNCSQHSPPMCWFGADGDAVESLLASGFQWTGGSPSDNYGRFHHEGWGDPGHSLETQSFSTQRTGLHHVEIIYGNGAGPFDTGIAAAVKHVSVIDTGSNQVVGEGFAVMPHLDTWNRWEGSSLVSVELEQGKSYRLVVGDHPRAVNMTVFSHFEAYTAGTGGAGGAFNRVNIAEIKVLAR